MKPNRSQLEAAKAVIGQYGVNYRNTGTDLHQNTAVMAVFAILTGQLARVPEEYRRCIGDVQLPPDLAQPGDAVELPEDAPSGESILVPVGEYDRTKAILEGITVDHEQRNLSITEDAAALLRNEGGDFPEPGIYITYESAGRMVEKVMTDAVDPDTIIGKELRQRIGAETEPNGDGKIAVDLDAMTVEGLKKFAAEKGIDLQDIGTKKADIIAAIREFGY